MMTYNPTNSLLVVTNNIGRIVKAYGGSIAKIMLEQEVNKGKYVKVTTMKVSKQWLENKIKELNDWLIDNEKGNHFEYAPQKHKRDYYVRKLIELEESQISNIQI